VVVACVGAAVVVVVACVGAAVVVVVACVGAAVVVVVAFVVLAALDEILTEITGPSAHPVGSATDCEGLYVSSATPTAK